MHQILLHPTVPVHKKVVSVILQVIPDEAEILEANVDAKLLGGKCEKWPQDRLWCCSSTGSRSQKQGRRRYIFGLNVLLNSEGWLLWSKNKTQPVTRYRESMSEKSMVGWNLPISSPENGPKAY